MGKFQRVRYRDNAAQTLPGWLQVQAHRRPHEIAIRRKIGGRWVERRWAELEKEVAQLAKMLALRGFGSGDSLILLTRARPESLLLALAAQWLGGSASMINPELDTEELLNLLTHLPLRFLFLEDSQQAERIQTLWERRAQPDLLLHTEEKEWQAIRLSHQIHYPDLAEQAPQIPLPEQKARADEIAFTFYQPQGNKAPLTLSLTHRDIVSEGQRVVQAQELTEREEALASRSFAAGGQARYLLAPWLIAGFCLNFPESLASRDRDRRELEPTLMLGAKDSYTRLAGLLKTQLDQQRSLGRYLADWAFDPDLQGLRRLLVDQLVHRPLVKWLGFARIRNALLVGEPLAPETSRIFQALGIEIRNWPDWSQWEALEQSDKPQLTPPLAWWSRA